MKTIEYIRSLNLSVEDTLDFLQEKKGIRSKISGNLVILNYSQIDSEKHDEIANECRGLVLNTDDWSLVARSFPRFFNFGEVENDPFNWNTATATLKEDGSLILIYHYDGEWRINTRGSFADSEIDGCSMTWKNLVLSTGLDFDRLDKNITYVCEICSTHNRIVIDYKQPKLFLITCFDGEEELGIAAIKVESILSEIEMVDSVKFTNDDFLFKRIEELSSSDPTFEGVVLRDSQNRRIKIKTKSYVRLHRLVSNKNLDDIGVILDILLSGEKEEVLVYFPELAPKFLFCENQIMILVKELEELWDDYKDLDIKSFALKVVGHNFSWVLFNRKRYGQDIFDSLVSNSNKLSNYIYDVLVGKVSNGTIKPNVWYHVVDNELKEVE